MRHQPLRHCIVWLITTTQLAAISGCATTKRVTLPGNEVPVGTDFRIATVVLKDGDVVTFDGNGGRYIERTVEGKPRRMIVGTVDGRSAEVDPEKALEVRFEQEGSVGGAGFAVGFLLGIPVGAGLLFLILLGAYSGH
jgi:hypothetical protein